jgi:hypothetical protein
VLEFDQPLPCDAKIDLHVYTPVTTTPGTLEHRLATSLPGAQPAAAEGEYFLLVGGNTFVAAPDDD